MIDPRDPQMNPEMAAFLRQAQTVAKLAAPPPPASAGAGGAGLDLTMGGALGEITWLLISSEAHRFRFINDMMWLVVPPLLTGQFKLYRAEGSKPVGVALWAFLSADWEAELHAGRLPRLPPEAWRSGDRHWLIDLVTPFGGRAEILAQFGAEFPRARVHPSVASSKAGV